MPLILRESRQEATPFDQLQAPTSEVFTTSVEEAFDDNPATKLFANAKLNLMESHGASPRLSKEEVADLAKQNGVELKDIPENGYKKEAAQYLIDRQYEKKKRQAILSTAESTFMNNAAQFGGGLVGSLVDPLNIASGFIPVVGQAKYLKMLQGASGALGRAGVRAGVGALEGAVGAVALEPLNYMASKNLQDDYTLANSAVNIAFGASMGAALHSVGGFVGDRLKISDYAKSPKPDAVPTPVDRIVEIPKEAKEEIHSLAARHVLDDNPVDISKLIDWEEHKISFDKEDRLALAKKLDPKAFEDVERIRGELASVQKELDLIDKEGLSARLAAEEAAPFKDRLETLNYALASEKEGFYSMTPEAWHRLVNEELDIKSQFDFKTIEAKAEQAGIDFEIFAKKLEEKKAALTEAQGRADAAYREASIQVKPNRIRFGEYPGRAASERLKLETAQSVKASLERPPNQLFLDEQILKNHATELETLKAEVGESSNVEATIDAETSLLDSELEATLEKMGKKDQIDAIREKAKAERAAYSDAEKALKAMADCVGRNG